MAGRTSTSVGVAATMVILGILCLTFFVLTAVFFGKFNDQQRMVQQLQADQAEIIRADERRSDTVRLLVQNAKAAGNKSLVTFMTDSMGQVMERVTGNRRDGLAELNRKLEGVSGADTGSLLSVIAARDSQLSSLQDNLQRAETARLQAQADQKNAADRIKLIADNHQRTIDALSAEISAYRAEIEEYRRGAEDYKSRVDQTLGRERTDFAETRRRLETQLAKVTDEKIILENQLAVLRGQKNLEAFRGRPEESLADGEIISIDGASRTVGLSIGAREKVVLGMTFAVYSDKNAIIPDAEGRYPAGKATIEVISVDETSSTARITSEVRGNPVVRGDVIANAIYDPNKVYKFVVFGNFDFNRDRLATALERQDIETMIASWGGRVVPDLSGEVDFLVLGERPLLPPRPAQDAPFEVVQEFIRRQREVERYDNLFRQATSTGIPVLNENRLYTLTGKNPARAR
ncbi:MAG: hypothetical protein KF864_03035 [Phycisphaeraceae bacterium]|nr:hypothetical protein [Phycisphaeraceae bacterium]